VLAYVLCVNLVCREMNIPQFPRIVDCFPALRPLPGCSVKEPQIVGTSLSYMVNEEQSTLSQFPSHSVTIVTPSPSPISSPSEDDDAAIPYGVDSTILHSELPTIPPPSQYWKLKKLDNTANVMDYWIKSSQEWDIDGIESDILVSSSSALDQ
jgi:hypothetical protein